MKMCVTLTLTALFVAQAAHADELTRQLQEELRRRYQYFGEIDGRGSEELSAAIRSYQKRKGFPVSGVADAATLGSLGVEGAPQAVAASPALPDGPVLRSDAAREVSEADREFLRSLEPVATGPSMAPPEPEPEPAPSDPATTEAGGFEQFIRDYLAWAQAPDPAQELRCYADRVDYFDHGQVDREFIEKDVRRYYKRWSERKFSIVSLNVRQTSPTEATVNFRIRFDLKGKGESASGQTDNVFKVRRGPKDFELVQLKEKRVRS